VTNLYESPYNEEPEYLAPIVASLIGRVIRSFTKSGKPWGWWAKLQQRVQTGENAGQFAEMGGLGLSKVKNSQGKVSSEIFTYIGPSNNGPTYGRFLITGSANIPDGVYHLPMEKVDLGVKAKLSEEYLQRIGAQSKALPSDPGLIIDISGVTREDASQEDLENSTRKLEPLPNLDKMAGKRKKTETTYSELTPGDLVFDEGDDVYGLVVSNDENGIWVRWQNRKISQVPTKNIDRPVFAWKQSEQEATLDKMAARKKKDETPEDGIAPEEPRSGLYKVKDLQKGDVIIFDDGQSYLITAEPKQTAKNSGFYRLALKDTITGDKLSAEIEQDESYQVIPPKPVDEETAADETGIEEEDNSPAKRTTVDALPAGQVIFDVATDQEYTFISASLEPNGKIWHVVVKDSDGKVSAIKVPRSSIIKQKMELRDGNTKYTPVINKVSREEIFAAKKPAINRYNQLASLYEKNREAIKSLPKDSGEIALIRKQNASIAQEMEKIESEMTKAGFTLEEYADGEKNTNNVTANDISVEENKKTEIAEGIDYEVYDDGVMAVFGKDYWENLDLLKQAVALFKQSGAGNVVMQYHGKGKDPKNPGYFRDLKRASHSLNFDIKKGTVEDAVKFIAESLKRLYEERQNSKDVSEETENFSGKPGTRGDLENGVSFEITSDGVIHFKGNLDKNEPAFDWLMFDAKDAVPAHETSLAEDDSEYTTSVLSRSDADRAKLIDALNEKLSTPITSKPEVGTQEYWKWVAEKIKEGKITQADLKEAVNALFTTASETTHRDLEGDVNRFLTKYFAENPDATKGQALEAFKNTDVYNSIASMRDTFKKIFGDVVDKAVFKNVEKKAIDDSNKLYNDEFDRQIDAFSAQISEKPTFNLEDPEGNKPYWKWLKQQIEAGTLSEEDRVEAIANVRDSTIDMALVDSLQSLETILRKLLDENPDITRAEARKRVKEIFSDFATAVMMDSSRVKYFGENFVNSREYRTAIVAAQRDINDSLMRNLSGIIGDFIPARRSTTATTAEEESYSASASELKIGDRVYIPLTDKKKSGTIVNITPVNDQWLKISLQDSDGNISLFEVRNTAQIDVIGKKPVVSESAPATTTTSTTTSAEPDSSEKSPLSLPLPADIPEMDFTGMSDEDKKIAIDTLLALENVRKAQEKMPAGEFPEWGKPYTPSFVISEADIAWAKNEKNAPLLQVLKDQLEQLGISDTDKQKLLRLVSQMPLNEARQAVLNIIDSNPLLSTEFYKRAENLGDVLKNLKALSVKEKISVPSALKNVSDIIPDGEKTDLSKSYTFEEFLEDKYPNIPLSDLINLPKHEKRIARERKLYDAWMEENKKRVYDQVFEMGNVQIRYSSKGKVTKKAFGLLSQVMKVVNDLTPPGGSKVKVTLADPEWMKELTGSDRTKGFTTFDESGINIVISERMFGPIKQKEEDGVDTQLAPFIGEFLKQYGIALYGSVVGAGFKAGKSATELEEIFKNKFDINEKSNGASEFGEMFADFFAKRLNESDEKNSDFEAFIVRAVNSGYRPTINLSNAMDLDGKEVLMQTGQRRAKSAGYSGAKELKGDALKKFEETENTQVVVDAKTGEVLYKPVRWLEGLPTFRDSSGSAGTLPDPVDSSNYRSNVSFMRFYHDTFAANNKTATESDLNDLMEFFNKKISEQRRETERMRVVRVDGTNTTIRWRESNFDNDQDARKSLNSVIKQVKQMHEIDALEDFPVSITLTKPNKFTPGEVLFTGPTKNEDWTGYKYVTEDGAFIVLDIDSRKRGAGVDGNWESNNGRELDNRLLQDLAHEYGHLVLELRTSGNNTNDPVFQKFIGLGYQLDPRLHPISEYASENHKESFAELWRTFLMHEIKGIRISADSPIRKFADFFYEIRGIPISDRYKKKPFPIIPRDPGIDRMAPETPEFKTIDLLTNDDQIIVEFEDREYFYSNALKPDGTPIENPQQMQAINAAYTLAVDAQNRLNYLNMSDFVATAAIANAKYNFVSRAKTLKDLYEGYFQSEYEKKSKNTNTSETVSRRVETDESSFQSGISTLGDMGIPKYVSDTLSENIRVTSSKVFGSYTDKRGTVFTLFFKNAELDLSKITEEDREILSTRTEDATTTYEGLGSTIQTWAYAFEGDLDDATKQSILDSSYSDFENTIRGRIDMKFFPKSYLLTSNYETGLKDDTAITYVDTKMSHRRRGLATALLVFSRQNSPKSRILHSSSRTPRGKYWSETADSNDSLFLDSTDRKEADRKKLEDLLKKADSLEVNQLDKMAPNYMAQSYGEILHPNLKDYTSDDPKGGLGQTNSVVGYISTKLLSALKGNYIENEDRVLEKIEDIRSGRGFKAPAIIFYNPSNNKAFVADGNHRVEASRRLDIGFTPARVITNYFQDNDNAQVLDNGFGETGVEVPFKDRPFPRDIHPALIFNPNDMYGTDSEVREAEIDKMAAKIGMWGGDVEGVSSRYLPDQDENLYEIFHPGTYVRIKSTNEIAQVFGHNLIESRDDETQQVSLINLGGVSVRILGGLVDDADFIPADDDPNNLQKNGSRRFTKGTSDDATFDHAYSVNDQRIYEDRIVSLDDLEDVTQSFMKVSDNPILFDDSMYVVQRETGIKGRVSKFVSPGIVEISELIGYDSDGRPVHRKHEIEIQELLPIQNQVPTLPDTPVRNLGKNMGNTLNNMDRINYTAARLNNFGYLSDTLFKAIVNLARFKFITKSGADKILEMLKNYDNLREYKVRGTPLDQKTDGATQKVKGNQVVSDKNEYPYKDLPYNKNLSERQNASFHRRVNSGIYPGIFSDSEKAELNKKFDEIKNRSDFNPIIEKLNERELIWRMDNGWPIDELVNKYYSDVNGEPALRTEDLTSKVKNYSPTKDENGKPLKEEKAPEPKKPAEPTPASEPTPEAEPTPAPAPAPIESQREPQSFTNVADFINRKLAQNEKSDSIDKMAPKLPITDSKNETNPPALSDIDVVEQAIAEDGVLTEKRKSELLQILPYLDKNSIKPIIDEVSTKLLNKRIINDESISGISIPDSYNTSKLEGYTAPGEVSIIDKMSNRDPGEISYGSSGMEPDEPKQFRLGEEQQEVLDTLLQTKEPFFLTGEAGAGKSTIVNQFIGILRDTGVASAVAAPTGIAALNVKGVTINSLLKMDPYKPQKDYNIGLWIQSLNPEKTAILKNLDVLVLDEISMVRADTLDLIDRMLRAVRGKIDKPFGGVQLVMVGDPYQLSPVVNDSDEYTKTFKETYASPWFFDAAVFKEFPMQGSQLSVLYRQSEDLDKEFIRVLRAVQKGEATQADLNWLWQVSEENKKTGIPSVIPALVPTNALAKTTNAEKLAQVNEPEYTLVGTFSGENASVERLKKAADAERGNLPEVNLKMKKGAQIIFVQNGAYWVNGTVGTIQDIKPIEWDDSGNPTNFSITALIPDEKGNMVQREVEKSKFVDQQIRLSTEFVGGNKKETVNMDPAGKYIQYPFKLGYAITVHKAQGQTLDAALIKYGIRDPETGESQKTGAFAEGQTYVALSRIKSSKGLFLEVPLDLRDVKISQRVKYFMGRMFGKSSQSNQPEIDRMAPKSDSNFASGDVFKTFGIKDGDIKYPTTLGAEEGVRRDTLDIVDNIFAESLKNSSWKFVSNTKLFVPQKLKAITADRITSDLLSKISASDAAKSFRLIQDLLSSSKANIRAIDDMALKMLLLEGKYFFDDTTSAIGWSNHNTLFFITEKEEKIVDMFYNFLSIERPESKEEASNLALNSLRSLADKIYKEALNPDSPFSNGGQTFEEISQLAEGEAEKSAAGVLTNLDRDGNIISAITAGKFVVSNDSDFKDRIEKLFVERGVSTLIQNWAQSSNDDNPLSLFIQERVEKIFNLDKAYPWENSDETEEDINALRNSPEISSLIDLFIESQYKNTQETLKNLEVDSVYVYRGQVLEEGSLGLGKVTKEIDKEIQMRPLSSWTFNLPTAAQFRDVYSSVDVDRENIAVDMLLSKKIPASRVFALPGSGVGCIEEYEAVVLGGVMGYDKLKANVKIDDPMSYLGILKRYRAFDAVREYIKSRRARILESLKFSLESGGRRNKGINNQGNYIYMLNQNIEKDGSSPYEVNVYTDYKNMDKAILMWEMLYSGDDGSRFPINLEFFKFDLMQEAKAEREYEEQEGIEKERRRKLNETNKLKTLLKLMIQGLEDSK
jgi:hypothetical protein